MTRTRRILDGAAAGLAGGVLLLPFIMAQGALPLIGQLVGRPTVAVGASLHFLVSAFIGATFALLLGRAVESSPTAAWLGLAYGGLWWLIGPLSLLPLMLSFRGAASVPEFSLLTPALSLGGHLLYGAVLGLSYSWLRGRLADAPTGRVSLAPARRAAGRASSTATTAAGD